MANCYVFKSLLQEYAQKVGLSTPVYQTEKEGPSHEPVFKSTVIVNDAKYESLPGFLNRKAAEQSAAEVALLQLQQSGETTVNIPTVHETGLCKNLLQEYAQKMNYAIPSYICQKRPSGHHFTCTVDIGGIQYIGAVAKTKKEAEIKAARTALLAIQQTATNGASQYTVLPGKRKAKEQETQSKSMQEVKPKKASFKKKKWSKKFRRTKDGLAAVLDAVELNRASEGEAMSVVQGNNVQGNNDEMSGRKEDEPLDRVNEAKPNGGFQSKKFRRTKDGLAAVLDAVELNRAIEGEDMSVVQGNNGEMSGRREDEPLDRVNEAKPNGCSQDQEQNNLTTMNAERSNESHEMQLADIAMLQQEVIKPVDLGSMSCLAG
ncbi:double-stranded RNA-binding protein 8-like [Iris pallida]|uniref:Double-stranded RNA-binding protein 8-like n=1 Tax=Iris pallida TaxID=29817 RepID=A0AAX6HF11_IRIPA|nr:double-stranded RNA-binding protein 8-like [Iris pallida]